MDCCNNRRSACTQRPQRQVPPYMNTGCTCGCGGSAQVPMNPMRPSQPIAPTQPPSLIQPRMQNQMNTAVSQPMRPMQPQQQVSPSCNSSMQGSELTCMPIGMAYVPWQKWCQTYALDRGFNRGTIFPELDLPFLMGRCQ